MCFGLEGNGVSKRTLRRSHVPPPTVVFCDRKKRVSWNMEIALSQAFLFALAVLVILMLVSVPVPFCFAAAFLILASSGGLSPSAQLSGSYWTMASLSILAIPL